MPHTLSGKWILHYFDGDIPWRTISDLPEDEALEINRPTGKTSGVCTITCKDFIYQHRLRVEAWDREQHLARGGRMENANPVYGILSEVEHPERPYRKGSCIAIPAEIVSIELMSVSFGDSFPNYLCRNRNDLSKLGSPHGRTYGPVEFSALVHARPQLATRWSAGYCGKEGFCIEVRLYTRNLPSPSRPERGPFRIRPAGQHNS